LYFFIVVWKYQANVQDRKKGEIFIRLLGEIFREKRKSKNLSIRKLSELTDISESELRRYEKGLIQEPKSVYLYRLSLVLEIDYEEVLRHRWAKYPKKLERIGIKVW